MEIIRPQTTTENDPSPNIGSKNIESSDANKTPTIVSENSENLSTKGEKLLAPTSLLPGRTPLSSIVFRSGKNA